MTFEYSSREELFKLIKQINDKYYERLNANILFIEELCDRIFVVYIVVLRDAYSHLIRIFDYDILSEQGKINAKNQLDKYLTHLQRGLIDTFRKILALEFKLLMDSIFRKDKKAIEYQIAKKAHELRIMKDISIDERIQGYILLLDHISEIRNKLLIKI